MMKNMYRNDEALTIRLKMPGTGKTVTSAPIHIGQKGGIDSAVISLKHEELPALAAGKTMTVMPGRNWIPRSWLRRGERAMVPAPEKCSCAFRWRPAPGCA